MGGDANRGLNRKNSPARKVNWKEEVKLTLKTTGLSKAELGEALGLFVTKAATPTQSRVCPQVYAWLGQKTVPPYYLLLALQWIRQEHEK